MQAALRSISRLAAAKQPSLRSSVRLAAKQPSLRSSNYGHNGELLKGQTEKHLWGERAERAVFAALAAFAAFKGQTVGWEGTTHDAPAGRPWRRPYPPWPMSRPCDTRNSWAFFLHTFAPNQPILGGEVPLRRQGSSHSRGPNGTWRPPGLSCLGGFRRQDNARRVQTSKGSGGRAEKGKPRNGRIAG